MINPESPTSIKEKESTPTPQIHDYGFEEIPSQDPKKHLKKILHKIIQEDIQCKWILTQNQDNWDFVFGPIQKIKFHTNLAREYYKTQGKKFNPASLRSAGHLFKNKENESLKLNEVSNLWNAIKNELPKITGQTSKQLEKQKNKAMKQIKKQLLQATKN